MSREKGLPPALLLQASQYGTLSAVRCLGRAGVPVTLADAATFAPARWSRHVHRRVRSPHARATGELLEWLLRFGRRYPGHVLLPTTDDLAWLYSAHRDELARDFRISAPPPAAIEALLSKRRLIEVSARAGLEAPASWFPERVEDVDRLAGAVTFPVLIKPTTQVLSVWGGKGERVDRAADLPQKFRAFAAVNRYLGRPPFEHGELPFLQAYVPDAENRILSIAGFTGEGGTPWIALGARKVLQRPRKLGIGLCFEEAPLDLRVTESLRELAWLTGFSGVFEAELIETGSRRLLIDFNPRFYSQMAFEIDRGLPLPLLAYYQALGDRAEVDALIQAARGRVGAGTSGRVYHHRLMLELMRRAQRLSGRMSPREAEGWGRWVREHDGLATDAAIARDDLLPAAVDWGSWLLYFARHPRAFVHRMVLDR